MRSLQCARAIAALFVVYFHAVLEIKRIFPPESDLFMLFGKCGVDVFFVLSGFIMWRSTSNGRSGALDFYKRRIARVAPLYWAVTAAAAAIALAAPSLLTSTRFDLAHLLASLAFLPWPNPAWRGGGDLLTPLVIPGWTLNFEIMFYAVFGLSLVGSKGNRLIRGAALFAFSTSVVIAMRPYSQIAAFYDPYLTAEFLLGVLIGLWIGKGQSLPVFIAWPLLVGSTGALIVLDARAFPFSRFYSSGLPAALIVCSLASIDTAARWPRMSMLTRLGDASFSIYLVHIFALAALRMVFTAFGLADYGSVLGQGTFVAAALLGSCALGLLTHHMVELPLERLAHRLFGLPPRRSALTRATPNAANVARSDAKRQDNAVSA